MDRGASRAVSERARASGSFDGQLIVIKLAEQHKSFPKGVRAANYFGVRRIDEGWRRRACARECCCVRVIKKNTSSVWVGGVRACLAHWQSGCRLRSPWQPPHAPQQPSRPRVEARPLGGQVTHTFGIECTMILAFYIRLWWLYSTFCTITIILSHGL